MKLKPLKLITREYLDNLNDPEVNEFLSTHNRRQSLKMVEKYINENHLFGIYVKDKLIGTCHLQPLPCAGILIFKNHQRKGYGLKVLNKVKRNGMLAGIDARNGASIRLFEKAGFRMRVMWEYNG